MKNWMNSEKGRKTYLKIRKEEKKLKEKEREQLKLIKDVKENQIVKIIIKKKEKKEKVIKVYDKTYKISLGNNDYVLIDKRSLNGYPNSIIKECTGDGRRFIGENIKLIIPKN